MIRYLQDRRGLESRERRRFLAALTLSAAVHATFLIVSLPVPGPWRQWSAPHIGFAGPELVLPELNPQDHPLEDQERLADARVRAGAIVDSKIEILPDPEATIQVPEPRAAGILGRDRRSNPVVELTESWDLRSTSEPSSRSLDFIIERMVRPEYPWTAIAREVEGMVRVQAAIDVQGRVRSVEILTPDADPDLVDATRRAMMRWKFKPYLVNGEAVEFTVLVPFRYRLE